jgi:predicted N-acetyltransferase YhbS
MGFDTVIADLALEEDAGDIIELSRVVYGSSDFAASREGYAWRHNQNPAGRAVVPVVRDPAGKVVGSISMVPVRVRVQGQTILGAAVGNLIIDRDYRKSFAYARLMRRFARVIAEQAIPVHFSFVSEHTYDRERRDAPESVTIVPLLAKALDMKALAREFPAGGWERFLASWLGPFASPFLFRRKPMAWIEGIDIAPAGLDNTEFDRFWLRVRDKYRVLAVRDRTHLAWRFSGSSRRDYQTLVARAGDRMLGYAVLSCALVRGLKTGLVMDFLVADEPSGVAAGHQLMAEAEAYFRSRGMSASAVLMMPFSAEHQLLRWSGYRQVPERFSPQRFRFQAVVHDAQTVDWRGLSAGDWFVTLADYESR